MTSIEWLDEKLQDKMFVEYGYINGIRKIVIPLEDYMKFKKEAKEMHHQEILNAVNINKRQYDNAEQYYQETYYNETYKPCQ